MRLRIIKFGVCHNISLTVIHESIILLQKTSTTLVHIKNKGVYIANAITIITIYSLL